jgi:hypothetical protein
VCVNTKFLAALAVYINMMPRAISNVKQVETVVSYLAMCVHRILILPVKKQADCLTKESALNVFTVSELKIRKETYSLTN